MGAGCDPKAEPEGCWAGLAPKPPKVEPPKEEKNNNSIFNFFTFTKNLRDHKTLATNVFFFARQILSK